MARGRRGIAAGQLRFFMLVGAIQSPLSDNVTVAGSGGHFYEVGGRTIVVVVILGLQ